MKFYCAILLMHVVYLHENGKVYNYVRKMRIKIYNWKLNIFRATINFYSNFLIMDFQYINLIMGRGRGIFSYQT